MAKDESEVLAFLGGPFSDLTPSAAPFRRFQRGSELLSYLILCVSKMPFIPPVSIARSVSGLTGKDKTNGAPSAPSVPAVAAAAAAKTKARREDKGSSVKERLASNLKQLGKKNLPRSHLPVAKGLPAPELLAKKKERFLPSSDGLPAVGSGESSSRTQQHKQVSRRAAKREPETRGRAQEEAGFTVTLAPEAVLLLQRRNSERHQRSRRERHPPAPQRHAALTCRADITSIVKISLLNEQHKYDDVEYEEEEEAWRVDERVVLKCTEWLRGLENSPVAVRNGLGGSTGGLKSF